MASSHQSGFVLFCCLSTAAHHLCCSYAGGHAKARKYDLAQTNIGMLGSDLEKVPWAVSVAFVC
jgi:hypothetical protein